ncbi:hypothetical protein JCM5350_001933 [Sporobolomyces pararoseus]
MSSKLVSSLPEETLDQIFSSNLHQHDLAVLCRVTKQFSIIVKPLLYRSITLCSIEQAEKFRRNGSGDAQLIESILITGKGDAWTAHSVVAVYDTMNELNEMGKRGKEPGLVKKVVEGEIVNPSQLKQLLIHQVFEDADVLSSDQLSVDYQIFANLTDLSIVGHRGGSQVLSGFLRQRFLPNLSRLTLCDLPKLTLVQRPIRALTTSIIPIIPMTSDGRVPCENVPVESEMLGEYLEGPISSRDFKLDLLVSPSYSFLTRHPSLLHLAILDSHHSLLSIDKYAVVYISTRPDSAVETDNVFIRLQRLVAYFSSYSVKYLALPSALETQLSTEKRTILNDLVNLGVSLHFDGDLGSVIASPSFFEFRKKEKEEEVRKNDNMN